MDGDRVDFDTDELIYKCSNALEEELNIHSPKLIYTKSGLVIDAAGFLGIEKKPVTLRKIAGMLLMLAGTALISFL